MLWLDLNAPAPLRVQATDGATGLFPQFKVYDAAGSVVTTINAAHLAGGLYTASWTPPTEGFFTVVSKFWTDAGHTVEAGYDVEATDTRVDSVHAALNRILGLVQENVVHDQQVYDGDGNLLSARVRTYDSAANALIAGGAGLVAQYALAAAYTSGRLTDYHVIRTA